MDLLTPIPYSIAQPCWKACRPRWWCTATGPDHLPRPAHRLRRGGAPRPETQGGGQRGNHLASTFRASRATSRRRIAGLARGHAARPPPAPRHGLTRPGVRGDLLAGRRAGRPAERPLAIAGLMTAWVGGHGPCAGAAPTRELRVGDPGGLLGVEPSSSHLLRLPRRDEAPWPPGCSRGAPRPAGSRVEQTAFFEPRGIPGVTCIVFFPPLSRFHLSWLMAPSKTGRG